MENIEVDIHCDMTFEKIISIHLVKRNGVIDWQYMRREKMSHSTDFKQIQEINVHSIQISTDRLSLPTSGLKMIYSSISGATQWFSAARALASV